MTNIRKLTLLIVLNYLLLFTLLASGCAANPKPSRPEGVPYPTKLQPRAKVYPMEKVRCLGGAMGGCNGILEGMLRR